MDHTLDPTDMDMSDPNQCNMNMLFNVSYHNLCIIFPSWHIRSLHSFFFSLLAIVILGAGYEAVREISRRVEMGSSNPVKLTERSPELDQERGLLLETGRSRNGYANGGGGGGGGGQTKKSLRALLYAVQVFYSFFIMLLFMTYNLWVMLAVAVGAFVGYMMFGGSSSTKTVACH